MFLVTNENMGLCLYIQVELSLSCPDLCSRLPKFLENINMQKCVERKEGAMLLDGRKGIILHHS